MNKKILHLLCENARLSEEQIADRLGISLNHVHDSIKEMEKDGIIKGYRAVIDDNVFPEDQVKAIIQVQTRPEREDGFDRIARRVSRFPEVESVYLISGSYDLQVVVTGPNLQEVAFFVSSKLASMEGVISTNSHFLLKKYKEAGMKLMEEEEYERLKITP